MNIYDEIGKHTTNDNELASPKTETETVDCCEPQQQAPKILNQDNAKVFCLFMVMTRASP
jgi:hypothetical protein